MEIWKSTEMDAIGAIGLCDGFCSFGQLKMGGQSYEQTKVISIS
jgi:hypothetical protein